MRDTFLEELHMELMGFQRKVPDDSQSRRIFELMQKLAEVDRFLGDEKCNLVPEDEPAGQPKYVPGLHLALADRYTQKEKKAKEPSKEFLHKYGFDNWDTNGWYSRRRDAIILITKRLSDGKVSSHRIHKFKRDRYNILMNTLAASTAWTIEAENKAVEKLQQLVGKERTDTYLLTGMVQEVSKKSRVQYIFRKGRPTLAFGRNRKYLAALCLHAMGYYSNSFAGVLVPTDDVIVHLLKMRSDEHGFWKKASQHPEFYPNAGY